MEAHDQLRASAQKVYDTFVRDRDQGYQSRDRQFAIEILGAALARCPVVLPPSDTYATDLLTALICAWDADDYDAFIRAAAAARTYLKVSRP